ncbi:hypothetical protein [Streptomyces swartbergensis]|uniref:hypothetical protein n=1 Tax=Streptomyces swartbergensis TaxID=487165 RepID=UPI00382F8ECC
MTAPLLAALRRTLAAIVWCRRHVVREFHAQLPSVEQLLAQGSGAARRLVELATTT